MPLVLAVHAIQQSSATVPFAVILLQDHITNRKVPVDFKCRQLVPSSGAVSTSLWDVSDAAALKAWLDESINVDVEHTLYEVQEEFAIGLGEVVRSRAAEKVTEGTKAVAQNTGRAIGTAATAVGQQAIELDHKLKLSERAAAASTAFKESTVGRTTTAAFGRIGSSVSAGTKKVFEHEKVQSASEVVNSSFKKLGASLSSLTGRRGSAGPEGGPDSIPQFVQDSGDGFAPPGHQPYAAPERVPSGGNLRNPGAGAAPAGPLAAGMPAAAERTAFTLDDSESKHA